MRYGRVEDFYKSIILMVEIRIKLAQTVNYISQSEKILRLSTLTNQITTYLKKMIKLNSISSMNRRSI